MNARLRVPSACLLAFAVWTSNALAGAWCGPVFAATTLRVAAQLLGYEKGYVLLTTGEAFKVAPGISLVDAKGGAAKVKPKLGDFVRLTFDASGAVSQIALSAEPFPAEEPLTDVERYSMLTPLAQPATPSLTELRNERVTVSFVVQVPTTTLPGDHVYMETSETSWNPLAVRLDRIDSQHFRVVLAVPVGSRFRYLFTRGNSQSIERGANGLQRPPRALLVRDLENHEVLDKVEHWGDEAGNAIIANPQTSPTPFNPAPYPNLPPVKINPAAPR